MEALASIWVTIFACRLTNFTTKLGFNIKTFLILHMSELNLEAPSHNAWIASTTLFESVSNVTCVIPRCSNYFIASSNVIASPFVIKHFPIFQEVPAKCQHKITCVCVVSYTPPCIGFVQRIVEFGINIAFVPSPRWFLPV
jgi:hypothetical protein